MQVERYDTKSKSAVRIMESSSNELSTPVSGKV